MKQYIPIVFFLISTFSVAQEGREVDSLKQALSKSTATDTTYLWTLNALIETYLNANNDSAMHYAEEMIARSQKIKNGKLERQGLYQLGKTLFLSGDFEAAKQVWENALASAHEAGSKSRLKTYIDLIGYAKYKLGDYEGAINNYEQVLSIAMEENDTALQAKMYNAIGMVYSNRKKYVEAIEFLDRSLSIYNTLPVTYNKGWTLLNLGVVYSSLEEQHKAKQLYEEALVIFESEQETRGVLLVLQNIAAVYDNLKEYESALIWYKRALKLQTDLGIKENLPLILRNIGTAYMSLEDYEQARKYFEKSVEESKTSGDRSENTSSLAALGVFHLEQGNNREALLFCGQALAMAEELELIEPQKDACECMAKAYENKKEYKKQAKYYKKFVVLKDSVYKEQNSSELIRRQAQFEFDRQLYTDSLQRAKEEKIKDLEHQQEVSRQKAFTYAGIAGLLLVLALAMVLYRDGQFRKRSLQIIAEKNREIVDSITYAKRIQGGILPTATEIQKVFNNSFVFFQPKDIVSGDFYWWMEVENQKLFAVADCTGHGVPGAMVSVLGVNGLNRVIREYKKTKPSEMLDQLTEIFEGAFSQQDDELKDGMDMALCAYDPEKKELEFAGANNPLYLIRKEEQEAGANFEKKESKNGWTVYRVKGQSQPIGKHAQRMAFENHTIPLKEGDSVYLFSDGYADQFGGEKGKKFSYRRFRELLLEIHTLSSEEQKSTLEKSLSNWMGDIDQVDDVCVMGVSFT